MHTADYAVARCLSVRPSVRHTPVCYQNIIKLFSNIITATRTSDTCRKQTHWDSTTVSVLVKCSLFSHNLCTVNTCTMILRLRQRCVFPPCVAVACRQRRVAVMILVTFFHHRVATPYSSFSLPNSME